MKKFWAAAALCAAVASLAYAAGLKVVVEEASVKKRPQFYAPTVAKVKLGDSVEAGELKNGWYQVSMDGQSGWLHSSAVTAASGHISGGAWQGGDSASASEVTLAGKGFNDSVEKDYRGSHPDLNFSAVNKMEGRGLSDKELMSFAKDGQLAGGEAGQ